jgi:OmpA-OmpF porin, OOP family
VVNVPHGLLAAVALGAAAVTLGAPHARAQLAVEGDGALPGRRSTRLGLFAGVVQFSDDVEIGNSYYDDQVPGLGMLIGVRGAAELARRGASRLDVEGEVRFALARTGAGGTRDAGSASVLGWRAHALVALFTDEPVRPFLLAGLGAETLVAGTEFMAVPDTDVVLYGGAGAELAIGPRSALRADLRLEMMAGRDGNGATAFEAALGWSHRFGGRGPRVGRIQIAARPAPPTEVVARPAPAPPEPEPPAVPRDPDPDRDGVLEPADRCPDQAETTNGFADADGCPDEVPPELAARLGDLAGVRFAPGTVRLDRRSRPVLDQLAAVLLRFPDVRVEIAAHTDVGGKPERELELTQQQAEYLKWYLVDKGIDEHRIDAVGRGSAAAGGTRIHVELVSAPGEPPPADGPEARGDAPPPFFLPSIPRPVWLSPYARAELPLFGPRPVWLSPR